MKEIIVGKTLTLQRTVTPALLACAMGSGDLEVYATPGMIALMEETSAALLKEFLEEGETSVGVSIHAEHTAATPCGMEITVTATVTAVDRRKVSFTVTARDEQEEIGTATHDRFVVLSDKFMSKASAKKA